MESSQIATVCVDVAVDKGLDYTIPEELYDRLKVGSRVKVPLQKKICFGTVVEIKNHSLFKIRESIQELITPQSCIPEDLFQLGLWISQYYGAAFFKIVKFLLPPSIRKTVEEKKQLFVKALVSSNQLVQICRKSRGAQAKILETLLKKPQGILLTELIEKTGVSRSPVLRLASHKVLSLTPIGIDRSLLENQEFFPTKHKTLNPEQQLALNKITKSLDRSQFETHLLYGITGSGKTEVYLQAISHVLNQGKSVIFLVPEIALTSQTVERLRSRFQEKVAVLHHRLSEGQKRDTWHKIQDGTISLVVGPRSALFSPFKNLGMIIVDEEHDAAYKQTEEMPCYHTRDTAVMRGKICQAVVVLGSATPSFESYTNALKGKYQLCELSKRADQATLPQMHLVDMRLEFAKSKGYTLFSDRLLTALKKRLSLGEQTLLFLNRRGFNTSAVCNACQQPLKCNHCSMSLTFHKGQNRLACHLCNFEISPIPYKCPVCKEEASFQFKGVGTEQVERALHVLFPEIRTLRLDADTTRHKGSHEILFKQFRTGKAEVLIGTQMIAKGLHFPAVTLVGILNADTALYIPDFRSSEYAFQMITQVSGRSGRAELKGEVIIQTRLPSHSTLQAAARLDYPSFYQEEITNRKLLGFPPFCHLVKIIFTAKESGEALCYAQEVRTKMIENLSCDYTIHPVIPCGYTKIKGLLRFQCLVKGLKTKPVVSILKTIKKHPKVQLFIDVDPFSTFF